MEILSIWALLGLVFGKKMLFCVDKVFKMKNIIDECKIEDILAEGGQKKVYRGNHPSLGDLVIKKGVIKSEISFERLRRECEFLMSIDSKYFPKNYGIYRISDLEFAILEQYIESNPLSFCTDTFKSEELIIDLFLELLNGMDEVWSNNVVHRDLKPDNILILPNKQPVIIDLGIARFLDQDSLTKSFLNQGPGTPNYASKEQLQNRKMNIDKRTDFFSLGLVVTELAIGFHPFDPVHVKRGGSIPENIVSGFHVNLFRYKELSRAFSIMATKLLDKEPYKRYRRASQIKNYLHSNWKK